MDELEVTGGIEETEVNDASDDLARDLFPS